MTAAGRVTGVLDGVLSSPDGIESPPEGGAWSVSGRAPDAVAFPESVVEMARLVERASSEGLRVRAAGAGSWLGGGGGGAGDVVVSTRRMDRIHDYVPGNLTLTAGAGLSMERLDRVARKSGQWFPQDPPGWRAGTLGAVVAAGLPGPLVASYGRPREQVLGLTLVTGDGRVLEPGGRVVKNVAGFDLVRLVAGSWGALGVLARVSVRLFPEPEVDRTVLWDGERPGDLVEAARGAATAATVPGALELLDPAPDDATAGLVAARLLGSRVTVDEEERILREAVGRPPDGRLRGEESRAWHRDRTREEGSGGAGAVELRAALLPSGLSRLLGLTDRILDGARGAGAGLRRIHLTTGVARIRLDPADGADPADSALPGIVREVRHEIRDEGGSLTVVRASPAFLRKVPAYGDPGTAAHLMEGLLRDFDPEGTMVSGLEAAVES